MIYISDEKIKELFDILKDEDEVIVGPDDEIISSYKKLEDYIKSQINSNLEYDFGVINVDAFIY